LLLALAAPAGTASAPQLFSFEVFAKTGLPLGDIVWRGERFLYVAERTGEIASSGPTGTALETFASLPAEYEEVRCARSPDDHGWTGGDLYCHGPHGEIWRVGADGSTTRFATLPETALQDGALTFDTGGGFGYALLAASGGSASKGGIVYAVEPGGSVRSVGAYPGPGGAENLALAPAWFGTASDQLLLAIDSRGEGGRLLAMTPSGAVRTLATFQYGINPIAVIGHDSAPPGAARPGVYLTDTLSKTVYFLPASQLAPYAGAVLVGREKGRALFWIVRPAAKGFSRLRVHSNLEHQTSLAPGEETAGSSGTSKGPPRSGSRDTRRLVTLRPALEPRRG
jgi:hypothetical protein